MWRWDGAPIGRLELPEAETVALPCNERDIVAVATKNANIEIWRLDTAVRIAGIKLDFAVVAMAMAADDTLVAVDGPGTILRFKVPSI